MYTDNTESIVLKDAQGRLRVLISTDSKTGDPYLQLLDANGCPRLELTMGQDGSPVIRMFSAKSMQAFAVGVSEELGGAGMEFFALDGSHGMDIGVNKNGVTFHSSGNILSTKT
jgi:hypothetical protein